MSRTYVPVREVDLWKLVQAYNAAYSDYLVPVYATVKSISQLQAQAAVDFDASAVVYQDKAIVGFGFLGVREKRGWISSVAVLPDQRDQGIGRGLMEYLIRTAQERGLQQLQLEVNEENARAIHLYESLGFRLRRRLLTVGLDEPPQSVAHQRLFRAHADHILQYYDACHPVPMAWQQEVPSLRAIAWDRGAWYMGEQVNAYALGYVWDGIIHFEDVGLRPGHEDDFRELLTTIHQGLPDHLCRMSNLPEDSPAWHGMQSLGYEAVIAEHEMVLSL